MRRFTFTSLLHTISVIMVAITFVTLVTYTKMVTLHHINSEKADMAVIDSLRGEVYKSDSVLSDTKSRLSQLYRLTWDNIDYWIKYFGIQNGEIVKKQIYLETGNLTSTICVENKNLFGMKYPGGGRETTALGIKNGHAYYYNYIESIHDYSLWQKEANYDGQEDYYSFLVRVKYAEDKRYVELLKSIPDSVVNR